MSAKKSDLPEPTPLRPSEYGYKPIVVVQLVAALNEHWRTQVEAEHERAERAEAALREVDSQLSRVLHEMAGAVSLCWEPRPEGVFESTQAAEFVAAAIAELRATARAIVDGEQT